MTRRWLLGILPVLGLLLFSCGSPGPGTGPAEAPPVPGVGASPLGGVGASPVRGVGASPLGEARPSPRARRELRGTGEAFRGLLVPAGTPGRWRYLDEGGHLQAEFKLESDRVKAKDPAGQDLLKLKYKDDGLEVEDPSGRRLLRAKLREGAWKVTDPDDRLLAWVKPETGGFRVEDVRTRRVVRVREGSGEVLFLDGQGSPLGSLRGTTEVEAAAWLVLPALDPVGRALLAVANLEAP